MKHRVWMVQEPNGAFVETEVAFREPKAGEVLVKIAASGVSMLDTKIRAGQAGHARQPLPAVLGLEMAGTVVAAGATVTKFRAGDAVFGMVGGVGGHQGTLGEYVVADADLLAHKPKRLSMREAAVMPLNVITAWEGMVDRAKVEAGNAVLVHAGAGGVGHLAVQIAKAFGATVYATISPEKRVIAESYGAIPIGYRAMTVEEYVGMYTQGRGFDIVYDTLGGATLDASFQAVKRYTGHVVSCLGWGTHALAPLSLRGATYSGVFTLLPLLTGEQRAHHGEILAEAAALADAGKLKPLVHETHFSPQEIDAAYRFTGSSGIGKAVIEFEG